MRHVLKNAAFFFLFILVLLLTLFLLGQRPLEDHLSMNRPLPARYLVVEGWIGDEARKQVAAYYMKDRDLQVLVTGSAIPSSYLMPTNGLLEFIPGAKLSTSIRADTLWARLRGSPVHGTFPMVHLTLNDSLCWQGEVGPDWADYPLACPKDVPLERVGIRFTNDHHQQGQDRNLEVAHIRMGLDTMEARSQQSRHYKEGDSLKLNPIPTNFGSVAALCAHELGRLGVDSRNITALPSPEQEDNRTLSSAMEVKKHLLHMHQAPTSLNLITQGIHSRRSYILYRRALKDLGCELGVIALSGEHKAWSPWKRRKEILRELGGIIYYRTLFNFSKFEAAYLVQEP